MGARLVLLLIVALAGAVRADEPPRRIVSANLCADRLVAALADQDRILSFSYYAADPAMSDLADRAAALPLNHGGAEEIAALHPDLVIFGSHTGRAAADMLKGLGIPVYFLPVPQSLEQLRQTIRELAARLGVPERGERLIARIDQGLAGLDKPRRPVRAAIFTAGGWTHGADSIDDDLLRRLGARNIAAEAGIVGVGSLPLERLVAADPQVIIIETITGSEPSLAAQLLDHPALAHGGARRVELPMKLWQCADGALVEAAQRIAEALR